jgi:hypothetical protein
VSLVAFHGRQDSVFDSMDEAALAPAGRVPATAGRAFGGSGQVARSATRCRDGTEVAVYELAAMGHAWPGATIDDPKSAPTPRSRPATCSGSSSKSTRGGAAEGWPVPGSGAPPLVVRVVREQPTPNPDPVSATIPTAHLGV